MRVLAPAFVALALVACAAEPEPEAVIVPPVVVEHPAAVTTTTVDADAVALWRAVELWNSTVTWNEAVAQNEREAAEAASRRTRVTGQGPGSTASYSSGTYKGLACGGSLPSCSVLACENPAGDPQAENPTSTASGVWQIIDGTWNGFGGYGHASYAPVSVQNQKAAQLWAGGAGASHWAACL